MGRSLYRFYLYFVSSILTFFSGAGLSTILGTELESTSLRYQYPGGYYGDPYGASPANISTQQLAFGGTLLVVAGALLSVHYWLIRRDVRSDPAGGASGNRAFFLNLVELIAALVALATGTAALTALGQRYHGDMAFIAGTAIASALIFTLVELERRRAQPDAGAAIIFQRLQQSLTPFLILTTLGLSYWTSAINDTANAIAVQWKLYDPCGYARTYGYPCTDPGFTQALPSQWLAVALVSAGWLVYLPLARGDGRSAIRQVLRFLGLAFATGLALNGVFQLADLVLIRASHELILPYEASEPVFFAGPLIFGLLGIVLYVLIIRADSAMSPLGHGNTISALLAVTAVVAAGPFWWGCGRVLRDLVEQMANGPFSPDGREWAAAFALVLSGVAYIPLALLLARRSSRLATPGPRRGFALGLLAAGTIAGAVGAAMALYAVMTNALGAPLDNWQEVARNGVVTLVIGVILAGIYGTIVVREHYIRPLPATSPATPAIPAAPAETVVAEPTTIEGALDALLAGKMSREEAAARIRALTGARTE